MVRNVCFVKYRMSSHFVSHRVTPCRAVAGMSCRIMPCRIMSCRACRAVFFHCVPCRFVPRRTAPCLRRVVPSHALSCCAVPYHAILCHAMPCHAVPCRVVWRCGRCDTAVAAAAVERGRRRCVNQ